MMSLPKVILVITIDVEEDNWGIYRKGLTVENVREISRLQTLFNRYGIKPTYLLSYQVASCDWAVNIFAKILAENKCEIGAHLHPWNTPPLRESLNERNSMLLNLPSELQVEKLKALTDQIKKAFGVKPESFRAGRWGLGSETVQALVACGYRIDTSVTPMTKWENGPTYSNGETEPYWLLGKDVIVKTMEENILEIPVTIGFNRWPFEFWEKVYQQLQKDWLKHLHPIGLLNRTGLLRKAWLSPEISSAHDMITLSKIIIKNGIRFLNLTFHSTSLLPGKSPFVKNNVDLEDFYSRLEKLLDYLKTSTDLNALSLSEVKKLLDNGYDKRPFDSRVCPSTSLEMVNPSEDLRP